MTNGVSKGEAESHLDVRERVSSNVADPTDPDPFARVNIERRTSVSVERAATCPASGRTDWTGSVILVGDEQRQINLVSDGFSSGMPCG